MPRKKNFTDPRKGSVKPTPIEEEQPLSKKELKKLRKAEQAEANQRYQEAYEAQEASYSIDVQSLHKSRRYKIIALLFLFICIAVFAAWFFLINQTAHGAETTCWSQQMDIESKATQYVTVNGFSSLPAYVEDIPDLPEYQCPRGGSYTWNPITGTYSCSEHGHHPDNFNAPKSQTLSVTETVNSSNESAAVTSGSTMLASQE